MRITLPDRERAGSFIKFTRQKTVNDAGSNSLRAQHHRHRGGKVLTVTGPDLEKKIRERIGPGGFQIKRITIVVAQIGLDRASGIIAISGSVLLNHGPAQFANARIEISGPLKI